MRSRWACLFHPRFQAKVVYVYWWGHSPCKILAEERLATTVFKCAMHVLGLLRKGRCLTQGKEVLLSPEVYYKFHYLGTALVKKGSEVYMDLGVTWIS